MKITGIIKDEIILEVITDSTDLSKSLESFFNQIINLVEIKVTGYNKDQDESND